MAEIEKYKKDFSSSKESNADLMRQIMGAFNEGEEYYNRIGKVLSVDDSEKTASVQVINGDTVEDVRLQQVGSDTGLFIKPSINSIVLLGWTDKTTAYISLFSEVDEIIFQNGTFGGLIKIDELTTKLNELNDKYNDLVNRLLTWVPVANDGGLALSTELKTPTPIAQNPSFNSSDYENENFKH